MTVLMTVNMIQKQKLAETLRQTPSLWVTPERRKQISIMAEAGKSITEIAEHYELTHSQMYQRLNRAGILKQVRTTPRRNVDWQSEKPHIVHRLRQQESVTSIGKTFNMQRGTFQEILRRLHISAKQERKTGLIQMEHAQ